MPAHFEYFHRVTFAEIDGQRHVNNVEYVRWMQDAAVAHSAVRGWDTKRYREADCGFVARRHTIEYLQPAFENDEIVIQTWVVDLQKITSTRRYRMVRSADGTILAKAETTWALITLSTGRPKRIPPELREAFAGILSDEEL